MRRLKRWFFSDFMTMTVRALVLCETGLLLWALLTWTNLPAWVSVGLTLIVWGLLNALQPVFTLRLRRRLFTRTWQRLAIRGYFGFCIACMLAGLALVIVLAPSLLAWLGAGVVSDAAAVWMGDVTRILSTSAVGGVFLLVAYGCTLGQWYVRRPRTDVPMPHLPVALRGLRIAHITDLHLGHHLHGDQLRAYVAQVNATEPDLVCITGDIVDHDPAWIDRTMPDLAGLRARYGVYAVLGNHDYYTGTELVDRGLRRHTDFVVLRNEWQRVEIDGESLCIIGLDDPSTHFGQWSVDAFPLAEVIADLPDDAPAILLCHRPDVWHLAIEHGIPFTMVGHTHGGQLAVPGVRHLSLARLISPYPSGWYERDGCLLYVNRGLGVAGSPIRIGAPREIAIHELQQAAHAPATAAVAPVPAEAAAE